MKRKIVFLMVILILVIGGFAGYKYLYQDHRNIDTETAFMNVNTAQLQRQFVDNTEASVLNKTIIVTGNITQIEENTITLDNKVHCSFMVLQEGLAVDDTVSVKGRCIGYDDLFELVKIDQSIVTDRK
jgi:hypothetical protein